MHICLIVFCFSRIENGFWAKRGLSVPYDSPLKFLSSCKNLNYVLFT
jgi:hypothetical protein